MLVLQRNPDEIINFDNNYEMKVLRITPDAVVVEVKKIEQRFEKQISLQQSIYLNDSIEVKLLKLNNSYGINAHFGITAPDDVKIWRNEVYRAMRGNINKRQRKRPYYAHLDNSVEKL